jgi:segregation and condensation protein A
MVDCFDDGEHRRDAADAALIVDVGGFEGPLDLLLELARRQKVDLRHISILSLAEQYLVFIDQARLLRLELAADYLVMAAWLAYLKSRLLLPAEREKDEPSAEELAAGLAARLRKLEKIRLLAGHLAERNGEAAEVSARGAPEAVVVTTHGEFEASLFDLLAAYARQRQLKARSRVTIAKRFVWSLQEAREALERLIGEIGDWTPIDSFLTSYALEPGRARTVRASSLAAMLELVREGEMELRQEAAFAPLYVRRRRRLTLAVG